MRRFLAATAIIAAAAVATSACGRDRGDAGATVSKNYSVGNFHRIEVAGPYDVEIHTGANAAVSARGSEKLLDHTTVEVDGDKLVIKPKRENGWFNWGWHSNGKADFNVTVPQLSGATIAGSGDIRVDRVQVPSFEGAVAGSGGLDVGTIDVQSLKLTIAGSGGIKANGGRARTAQYGIAGSGDVDAGAVQTEQAKVSIQGSGSVRAHASGTADVSIMGSGDVDVSGGAKCNVTKAGSGDVRCS